MEHTNPSEPIKDGDNEMSHYDKLLKQVENLKLENSSLKKELNSNTSQITQLESLTADLKEMVVHLGHSIGPQQPTIGSIADCRPGEFPSMQYNSFSHNMSLPLIQSHQYSSSSLQTLNSYSIMVNHSPGPNYSPEVLWQIKDLQSRKSAILKSLQREEITKEIYLRRLNDFNDKLKNMAETDTPFSSSAEQTRRSLEANVREAQEKMEKELGSPNMMRYRVQDWLQQIKLIEQELQKLQRQYLCLEPSAKPKPGVGEPMNGTRKSLELENGAYERYNTFTRGCHSLTDVSTQTPRSVCKFETLHHDMLNLSSPVESESNNGSWKLLSRATQTHQTCMGNLSPSSVKPLGQVVRLGSATSLPEHLHQYDLSNISYADADNPNAFGLSSLPHQVASSSNDPKVNPVEMISKLGSNDPEEMSKMLYSLSHSMDNNSTLRQAGCMQILIQVLHDGSMLSPHKVSKQKLSKRKEVKEYASKALRCIVCSNPDKEEGKMEDLILRHLEEIRAHCDAVYHYICNRSFAENSDAAPRSPLRDKSTPPVIKEVLVKSVNEIMRCSYNETIRATVNDLGGLFCMAELLLLDCKLNGQEESKSEFSTLLRQYAGHTLTTLTYGHSTNKTMLINMPGLIEVLIEQLQWNSEEIPQVTASILRNLSWQADEHGREVLQQKGVVKVLTERVIRVEREGTLQSMLGALWNLSGHSPQNRIDICNVEGSLAYLVSTLTYRSPSKSSQVTENGGGILRNVSSLIATNEEYRQVLRDHGCLQILLKQLSSPSLTIVSNACGTLWNLSARNQIDQQSLFELGAVEKLRKLMHSKHKVISQGCIAALRNLLLNQPEKLSSLFSSDADSSNGLPSLQARKLKQLQSELKEATSQSTSDLSETFSPRHHAQVKTNQQSSLKSSSQRHSLQERSGTSPSTKRKQHPGMMNWGSLGNLPLQSYNFTNPGQPFPAWEVHNGPKAKTPDDPDPCVAASFNTTGHNNNNNSSALDFEMAPGTYWDEKPMKIWGNRSLSNKRNNPRDTAWSNQSKTLPVSSRTLIKSALSSRMPTDLVEKLRHANNEDCMQEDEDVPVNYSLQDTDELPPSQGIKNPLASTTRFKNGDRPSQVPNIRFNKNFPKKASPLVDVDGKEGRVRFAAVNIHNSNVLPSQKEAAQNNGPLTRPKIDPSLEQKVMYADKELYESEERPTNYAIFTEEHLYDTCPEDFVLHRYEGVEVSQHPSIQMAGGKDNNQELVKNYHVEDTPICFSPHSSLSDLNGDEPVSLKPQKPVVENPTRTIKHLETNSMEKSHLPEHLHDEADDKFDSQPGTITPGHFMRSGRQSGLITPRTPTFQETPLMMYSPSSSRGSIDTSEEESFHSDVSSEPRSHMPSGYVSPSDLPDSPGQSMPQSRCRSPTNHSTVKQQQSFKSSDVSDNRVNKSGVEKVDDSNLLKSGPGKPSLSNVAGQQLINKAHAMSAGYMASLQPPDEMKSYNIEPAMSVISSFSGMTIDGVKVKPISDLPPVPTGPVDADKVAAKGKQDSAQVNGEKSELKDVGNRAIRQAGYVTSLPTNDEIKHFVCEGSMSPLTGLSEISAIRSHNDGFQKTSGSHVSKQHQSGTSNRNSYTSRSSATGASMPLPAISQQNEPFELQSAKAADQPAAAEAPEKDIQSPISSTGQSFVENAENAIDEDEADNLSDLLGTSSDDNEILNHCIKLAMPKKKSSRSKSSKSSSSSSRKEKPSKHNSPKPTGKPVVKKSTSGSQSEQNDVKSSPQPVPKPCKFDTRDRITAANSKLNGMGILEYIENKMASVPGDSSDSSENTKRLNAAKLRSNIAASVPKDGPKSSEPAGNVIERSETSRKVIKNVETLDGSYSVMKQLRISEKATQCKGEDAEELDNASSYKNMVDSHLPAGENNVKVHAFLQNRPVTFAVEGTPVEISRSTSLSNLTVESGPDSYDFSALQKKMVPESKEESPTNDRLPKVVQDTKSLSMQPEDQSNQHQNGVLLVDESETILSNLGEQIAGMAIDASDQEENPFNNASLPAAPPPLSDQNSSVVENQSNSPSKPEIVAQKSINSSQSYPSLHQANTDPSNAPSEHRRQNSEPANHHIIMSYDDFNDEHECQHYGEEQDHTKDKVHSYQIEDTPYCLSGDNSSLSSIDMNSEDEGCDLLKDCISSAMPVARTDRNMPLPPNQLVLMQQNSQPHSVGHNHTTNGQFQLNSLQSPNEAEWAAVHRGANVAAARLAQDKPLNAISPLSLVSLSSPDQPSTSFSLSTGQGTQTSDGYYRLSRQPSVGDSINSDISMGSLLLGGDAKSLMKGQNANKPKIIKKKETNSGCGSSEDKPPTIKGGKKIYHSPITGKPRENLRYPSHNHDNNSSCSSSTNRNGRRNHTSGSNKSPCNKCFSRQLPMSSSLGRLEGSAPGRSCKNTSSNYNSKQQIPCGHPHEPRKPIRSRSVHAGYHSGVTRLYPRLEEIDSIMLSGVASMAARGDMVLAQCDGQTSQYVPVANPTVYAHHAYHRPVLVKQGTFIQECPSSALLQSGAHNIPTIFKVVNKPQGSRANKQPQANAKNKVAFTKRLKKLLSPSEEKKTISRTSQKASAKKKYTTAKSKTTKQSKNNQVLEDKPVMANTNTSNKRKEKVTSKDMKPKQKAGASKLCNKSQFYAAGNGGSSSLSLSSSSASNESSGSLEVHHQQPSKKSIYPTVSSITSTNHIPKSPAAKARFGVEKQSSSNAKSSTSASHGGASSSLSSVSLSRNMLTPRKNSSSSTSSRALSSRNSGSKYSSSLKKKPGSQTFLPSHAPGKSPVKLASSSVTSDQHAVSAYDESHGSSSPQSPDDPRMLLPGVRRVVQEVAPFNYNPSPLHVVPSDPGKPDSSRKQTTV